MDHYFSNDPVNKQVFEDLQLSEARFQALFENTSIGIGLLGMDRRVIDANPALCRLYGRTREELIGQTPELVTDPEDYPQSTQDFQDFASGKVDSYQAERRYIRRGSGPFWAQVTMNIVRDANGSPAYIVGMVVDIDERKKAALELRTSEEQFRAVFEGSAIGMGLLDADGRILKVNDAVCRISGYSAEELLQRKDQDNVYPEDAEIDQPLIEELHAGTRDSYDVEKRYVRKDGRVIWAHLTISAVRNQDGSISHMVGMIEDIDEQKRLMINLKESEARFRAIFDNTVIGITLSTLDRRVLQMNEALSRITGYSLENLDGLHPTDLTHPEDRYLGIEEFTELLEGKRSAYSIERRYFHKDGRIFWGRVTYSTVCDADGKPCNLVGLMEDITEEKLANERIAGQEAEYRSKLEQEVEERTRDLKSINLQLEEEIAQRQKAEQALADKAAQDAVLGERSRLARELHDAVTQTLFSTSMIAEVLPDLWDINPEEGRRRLEELRLLTRGALAEMRTLLIELRPNSLVQIPLNELVRQLCEALISRAKLPIVFSYQGEMPVPPDVKIAFYRIAQEALNNIVKHAKATHVTVSLGLEEGVSLTIVDDGCGFDVSAVTAEHLGLRIMCERAEAIQASCDVESTPGKGTQISVCWDCPEAGLDE